MSINYIFGQQVCKQAHAHAKLCYCSIFIQSSDWFMSHCTALNKPVPHCRRSSSFSDILYRFTSTFCRRMVAHNNLSTTRLYRYYRGKTIPRQSQFSQTQTSRCVSYVYTLPPKRSSIIKREGLFVAFLHPLPDFYWKWWRIHKNENVCKDLNSYPNSTGISRTIRYCETIRYRPHPTFLYSNVDFFSVVRQISKLEFLFDSPSFQFTIDGLYPSLAAQSPV